MSTDEEDLIVLVYTSAATRPLSRDELRAMLEGGRRRNAKRAVTGLLVYHDQMFMQVIEGPLSAVEDLFATITADRRHRGIFVLMKARVASRQFPDHSMAFRDMTGAPLPEGFRGLLNDGPTSERLATDAGVLHRVLHQYADTLRRRPG